MSKMKLLGKYKSSIQIFIAGYQYPKLENEPYDSDWLNVSISAIHPRGNWVATDPSLLTFELRELGQWLEAIRDQPEISRELGFTEPTLMFEYMPSESDRVLRIYFEVEMRPEWERYDKTDWGGFWIDVPFDHEAFSEAAEAIADECKCFPQRASTE